jgi:hypothetical protein
MRLACWFRRLDETVFTEKSAIARTGPPTRETPALPRPKSEVAKSKDAWRGELLFPAAPQSFALQHLLSFHDRINRCEVV